jgi:type IV secretory pathway VirB4 component
VTDFCTVLKKEEPGGDLSRRLAAYLHLFPQHTQVKFDSQHTLYNLSQLPEALRPAATYLITERLWSALQEGREREMTRHLVVIDEAWFLSKFEYGAVLLNEFARRIRKYGGGLWAGTQQIGDLLSSEQGKNLLALCETKILFKQDVSSIDAVQAILHLSAAQMKLLRTARSGEALYITSKDTFAVEILASEQEAAMARTTGERSG